jgi:hypothetical protein
MQSQLSWFVTSFSCPRMSPVLGSNPDQRIYVFSIVRLLSRSDRMSGLIRETIGWTAVLPVYSGLFAQLVQCELIRETSGWTTVLPVYSGSLAQLVQCA